MYCFTDSSQLRRLNGAVCNVMLFVSVDLELDCIHCRVLVEHYMRSYFFMCRICLMDVSACIVCVRVFMLGYGFVCVG